VGFRESPLEIVDVSVIHTPFVGSFAGKRVVVTGHTGFKGSWLCEWLLSLGAEVTGLALEPDTTPSLFEQLGLRDRLNDVVGDIRSQETVSRVLGAAKPDFLFHMAAQPLVRRSYREPVETWDTNVLGTIHVMEALRRLDKPCAAVFVTTDKCYENREWLWGYRETDPLGGHDPYSSSKAAAEIAVASWRRSFFQGPDNSVRIASARAGNVVGGGDWAEDRIVPDCMRALSRGEAIKVRNPAATRPWQHVLEPLAGYLALAAALANRPGDANLESAFNIGPDRESNRPVRDLVEAVCKAWSGRWEDLSDPHAVHEATLLHLDNAKAEALLGWRPTWAFDRTIDVTVAWYRDLRDSASASAVAARTLQDIRAYENDARGRGVAWAVSHPTPLPRTVHA
jgi:CDP-glucose 4,6-dehydratase